MLTAPLSTPHVVERLHTLKWSCHITDGFPEHELMETREV